MTPIKFSQANQEVVANGKHVPHYQDSNKTICLYELSADELSLLLKTGKLWLKYTHAVQDPWMKWAHPTVHSPFFQPKPLEVDESVADKVVIHVEEDEELIFVKMDRGMIINPSTMFKEKVKVFGHGLEPKCERYHHLLLQYKLDPAWTYILKRVRTE